MYSRGSRSSNYECSNKCLYSEFKVMPGAKAQHAAVGLRCRASGLSPGEDPTHPLVQPGCVFLKANFAPNTFTDSRLFSSAQLSANIAAQSHVSSVHVFRLPVYFSDNVHVNKEFILCTVCIQQDCWIYFPE